jgi:hypothetical protein
MYYFTGFKRGLEIVEMPGISPTLFTGLEKPLNYCSSLKIENVLEKSGILSFHMKKFSVQISFRIFAFVSS